MAVAAIGVIDSWLAARLKPEALTWLRAQVAKVADGDAKALFTGFSAASRWSGKDDLAPGAEALAAATAARRDWRPARWSLDQLARTRLILALPAADHGAWLATLDRLCAAADVGELVAFYQALPLLPNPELLRPRAAEGVRSNIRPAFEAVALDNPYPSEQLDDGAFNQAVVKALFVGAGLARVVGLERRANPALTATLVDFARERRAAGRAVPPDLWRAVAPRADQRALDELARALAGDDQRERRAAALALATIATPAAAAVLAAAPDLAAQARAGALAWDDAARPATPR